MPPLCPIQLLELSEGSSMETKISQLHRSIARSEIASAAQDGRSKGGNAARRGRSPSVSEVPVGRLSPSRRRPRVTALYIIAALCVRVAYSSPDRIGVVRSSVFRPFPFDRHQSEPVSGLPSAVVPASVRPGPPAPACARPGPLASRSLLPPPGCLSDCQIKRQAGPAGQ